MSFYGYDFLFICIFIKFRRISLCRCCCLLEGKKAVVKLKYLENLHLIFNWISKLFMDVTWKTIRHWDLFVSSVPTEKSNEKLKYQNNGYKRPLTLIKCPLNGMPGEFIILSSFFWSTVYWLMAIVLKCFSISVYIWWYTKT